MTAPERSGDVQTFLFADLAGFTALTEAHGDEAAADLASEFSEWVDALAAGYGAARVKAIGDAVMIRCERADRAVELGLHIVTDFGARHGFPEIRAGMHTGAAVERNGDWFGATVNVAARISGIAGGGEVLLSQATRETAGEVAGVAFRAAGEHRLKNVGEALSLFSASASEGAAPELRVDPVCRMAVDPAHRAGRLEFEGVEYEFCSLECAQQFAADPGRYAPAGGA